MVSAVILKTDGNILNINIRLLKKDTGSNVSSYFRKFKRHINKNSENSIEMIDVWDVEDFLLIGYGISNGNESELNKHELFPTKNKKHFYGNILIIKTNLNKQIIDLTANLYEKYYNNLYGYYSGNDDDDCDSNNELDEYILNDSSNESISDICESDTEDEEIFQHKITLCCNDEKELELESYVSDY